MLINDKTICCSLNLNVVSNLIMFLLIHSDRARHIIVGSLSKVAFAGHSSCPRSLGLGPRLTLIALTWVFSEDHCLVEGSWLQEGDARQGDEE